MSMITIYSFEDKGLGSAVYSPQQAHVTPGSGSQKKITFSHSFQNSN
jgi:hypothetical protein